MKMRPKQTAALVLFSAIPYPFRVSAFNYRPFVSWAAGAFVKCWEAVFHFVPWLWGSIPSYLPFYLTTVVVIYAGFKGWKRATVISPFQLPSGSNLPFGEHTVANALQDAFVDIRERSEKGIEEQTNAQIRQLLSGLEGFKLPEAPNVEVPTRFAVEVKGISHEALISLGRKVLGKERVISGDVVIDAAGFRLLARSGRGIWRSGPSGATIEGLQGACHEVALGALENIDPILLAAHELAIGQFAGAYRRLHKMMQDA